MTIQILSMLVFDEGNLAVEPSKYPLTAYRSNMRTNIASHMMEIYWGKDRVEGEYSHHL